MSNHQQEKTKRKRRMSGNVLLSIGILCLLYFILYIIFVDLTNVFTYFWLVAGIGCIVIKQLLEYFEKNQIVIPSIAKWIIFILFLLVCLVLAMTEMIIISYGNREPSAKADYVLVLGAQVKGSVPSYALQKRLDAAYEYLMDNPGTKVMLSGGKGPGEDVTEAYAMSVYLQAMGIDKNRMILEEQSTNTDENIRYSMKLMDNPGDKVVLVTNYFHVYRGVGVAKKQGLSNVEGLGAPTKWYTVPNQYLREAFAVIKYKICGQI